MPILSIITINKNNAEGLLKTIESVVEQTFNDFEYLIVDGESSDLSLQTIKRFCNSSRPQFSWISEPDSGIFNAMNKGIKKSRGEYLLFLNSGDFLVNKEVLERVFHEKNTEDILCGQSIVSDKGKAIYTTNTPDFFKLSNFYKSTISHQATFIKRNLFDKFGLYKEDLKLMSDWEFWIRSIILGNASTKKLDIVISDYNLDGISSDINNKALIEIERSRVWTDLGLKNIIPDYQAWEQEQNNMAIMYWVKSKSFIYELLLLVYRIAVKVKINKTK